MPEFAGQDLFTGGVGSVEAPWEDAFEGPSWANTESTILFSFSNHYRLAKEWGGDGFVTSVTFVHGPK